MIPLIVRAEEPINPLLPAPSDLVWGAICFIVILVFFIARVLPRMQKLLDERGEAIEGNIAKADEKEKEAEALLEQYTAQLAEARAEAGRIRDQARGDGQKIVAEAQERAGTEAERIQASARAQIEADRQAAVTSLRSEVGTLALDLASNVIGESLRDDQRAEAVVDRFLADLERSESEASPASSGTSA